MKNLSHFRPILWTSLVVVAVFSASQFDLCSYDEFLHTFAGKAIVHSWTIPHTGIGSALFANAPWIDHEWLFQIMLFGSHWLGGWTGVIIFRGIILAGIFGLVYWTAVTRMKLSPWMTMGMVAMTWGILRRELFLAARPYLVSYLGIVLLSLLIHRWKEQNYEWKGKVLFPLLFLCWVNMHPGFLVGVALFGFACLEALMHRETPSPKKWQIVYLFLISLATLFANPYGWKLLAQPIRFLLDTDMLANNQDWQPFQPARFPTFLLLAAVSLTLFLFSTPRQRIWEVAGFGVMILFVIGHARHVSIAVFFLLVVNTHSTWILWKDPNRPRAFRRWLIWGWLGLGTLSLVFSPSFREPLFRYERAWHLYVPETALNIIDQNGWQGKIYNFFDWGSYILWKGYPNMHVAIDGRGELYPPQYHRFYAWTLLSGKNPTPWLRKNGFRTVLLRNDLRLAGVLAQDPSWEKVYSDSICTLFRSKP